VTSYLSKYNRLEAVMTQIYQLKLVGLQKDQIILQGDSMGIAFVDLGFVPKGRSKV